MTEEKIYDLEFLASFGKPTELPKPDRPEYVFAGRSNVGKSSLLNMLARRKKLAHVSNTPGKTQTFNFYSVNKQWYIVDVPGYGYAKRSKTLRETWNKHFRSYLNKRSNLMCVFLLIDMRVPPQEIDIDFMEWMAERQIPFVIVFTKSDKLKPIEKKKALEQYKEKLLSDWEEFPSYLITSSERKIGRMELLSFMETTNVSFDESFK